MLIPSHPSTPKWKNHFPGALSVATVYKRDRRDVAFRDRCGNSNVDRSGQAPSARFRVLGWTRGGVRCSSGLPALSASRINELDAPDLTSLQHAAP